jgi:hypothetical protein
MKRRLLSAVLTAAALLAACRATPASSPAPSAGDAPAPAPTQSDPTRTAVGSPPTPTARPGLEATDPTTLSLEGDRPTFVEFFAFW